MAPGHSQNLEGLPYQEPRHLDTVHAIGGLVAVTVLAEDNAELGTIRARITAWVVGVEQRDEIPDEGPGADTDDLLAVELIEGLGKRRVAPIFQGASTRDIRAARKIEVPRAAGVHALRGESRIPPKAQKLPLLQLDAAGVVSAASEHRDTRR